MPGFSPYVQAAQQRGGMSSYGGGNYGRYRPNLDGAVTGPTGTGGTGGGPAALAESRAGGDQVFAEKIQQGREQAENQAANNALNAADQTKSVEAYREARDNGAGMDGLAYRNNLTTQAKQLGIDPSSSAADVAAAASGPTNLAAGTGAGTSGALKPNSADVATSAAAAQTAKDGGQDQTLSNSYANGFNGGPSPTGMNPFNAGAPAAAMPPMPSLTYNPPPSALAPAPAPQPAVNAPPPVVAKIAPVPRMTSATNQYATVGRAPAPRRQPALAY